MELIVRRELMKELLRHRTTLDELQRSAIVGDAVEYQ